jgi:hypothetical protein
MAVQHPRYAGRRPDGVATNTLFVVVVVVDAKTRVTPETEST